MILLRCWLFLFHCIIIRKRKAARARIFYTYFFSVLLHFRNSNLLLVFTIFKNVCRLKKVWIIVCLSQGEEGVRQVLDILRDELSLAMALSGKSSLSDKSLEWKLYKILLCSINLKYYRWLLIRQINLVDNIGIAHSQLIDGLVYQIISYFKFIKLSFQSQQSNPPQKKKKRRRDWHLVVPTNLLFIDSFYLSTPCYFFPIYPHRAKLIVIKRLTILIFS